MLMRSVCAGVCLLFPLLAQAEQGGRFNVVEENDAFIQKNDRHYTQGLRFAYTTPNQPADGMWRDTYDWLGHYTPLFPASEAGAPRRVSWMLGQSMFTPLSIRVANPPADQHPYGGWLYGSLGWMQDNHSRSLDYAELTVGMVGSAALAEQVQNGFHSLFNHNKAEGWDTQLENEPGVMLSLERKWRMHYPLGAGHGIELIPEAGVTLGNVFTYAATGAQLRFGRGLLADYGQARIRPALSGNEYYNTDLLPGGWGYAVFAGVQGRAMVRNIFLDGNTFGDSRSVDKEPLVGDFSAGASLYLPYGMRADAAYTYRTHEFETQTVTDTFGGVNVSVGF